MSDTTWKEIKEVMNHNKGIGHGKDREPFISNHSGYDYEGSENFEHDDNGAIMNYSGVMDDVYNSIAEHEDWEDGYDY
ncbi:hypothetical protein D5125_02825 [Magnetovirga frankeli]|uniref:hypothetical protein n=1 Tax=Magnetovirga frankeli TaxID=947516 RepID=UPI001293384A|nr:hypothetical protein D5125_02825 [gamma proteobacterium SS-5]